jgi:hypothetical protein
MHPIELAKLNPSDMEMNADSPVNYQLLLPFVKNLTFNSKQNKLYKCSQDLFQSLHLNASTGLLTLNTSLDRETCSNYLYYVRATDLAEPRIYSLVNLKIRVKDIDDNEGHFEQSSYTFYIAEKTMTLNEKQLMVRIVDADHTNDHVYHFKMENQLANDNNENLAKHFDVVKDERDQRVLNLVIKRPLDFKSQKKFVFKLYMLNNNNNNDEDCYLKA